MVGIQGVMHGVTVVQDDVLRQSGRLRRGQAKFAGT